MDLWLQYLIACSLFELLLLANLIILLRCKRSEFIYKRSIPILLVFFTSHAIIGAFFILSFPHFEPLEGEIPCSLRDRFLVFVVLPVWICTGNIR